MLRYFRLSRPFPKGGDCLCGVPAPKDAARCPVAKCLACDSLQCPPADGKVKCQVCLHGLLWPTANVYDLQCFFKGCKRQAVASKGKRLACHTHMRMITVPYEGADITLHQHMLLLLTYREDVWELT